MENVTLKKIILLTLATSAIVAGGLALSPSYSPYGNEKPAIGEENLTVKNINWCFRQATVKNYLYTNSSSSHRVYDEVRALEKGIQSELNKRCVSDNPSALKWKLSRMVNLINYFSIRDETQALLESVGGKFSKFSTLED